jgi:hypothetical protein
MKNSNYVYSIIYTWKYIQHIYTFCEDLSKSTVGTFWNTGFRMPLSVALTYPVYKRETIYQLDVKSNAHEIHLNPLVKQHIQWGNDQRPKVKMFFCSKIVK